MCYLIVLVIDLFGWSDFFNFFWEISSMFVLLFWFLKSILVPLELQKLLSDSNYGKTKVLVTESNVSMKPVRFYSQLWASLCNFAIWLCCISFFVVSNEFVIVAMLFSFAIIFACFWHGELWHLSCYVLNAWKLSNLLASERQNQTFDSQIIRGVTLSKLNLAVVAM